MLFSSMVFIFVFLPFVCCTYFLLKLIAPDKIMLRNFFLLCASLFFYSWGEPLYIFLMLISIIANYFFHNIEAKSFLLSPLYVTSHFYYSLNMQTFLYRM